MSQQGKAYTESEWLARAVEIDNIMSTEGLSLTAACARLGINKQSVYNAREKFEAFNASVELSLGKRQEFLELQLMEYVKGSRRGSPAAAIFALKNAAPKDWRETYALTDGDGSALKIEHIVRTIVDPEVKIIEGELNSPQLEYVSETENP